MFEQCNIIILLISNFRVHQPKLKLLGFQLFILSLEQQKGDITIEEKLAFCGIHFSRNKLNRLEPERF